MAWAPSSPVTGSSQTGLTSPTYTLSTDTAPSSNGKQYAVTALGGTQTGVSTTGASTPFTISFFKPAVLKTRTFDGDGNAVSAPMNVYKQITRKSVAVDANGGTRVMLVTTSIEVPAGGEAVDSEDVRAALSLHIGTLSAESSDIGDAVITGVI